MRSMAMRYGWDDALEFQNELRYALRSDEYARYLRWYSKGQSRGVSYDIRNAPHEQRMGETELGWLAAFASTKAVDDEYDPMWVNREVLDLVEYAAESTNPPFRPEALMEWDLVVPEAFCVFERAMHCHDIEGRDISYRAASWGPYDDPSGGIKPGLMVALWRHKDDEDDYSRHQPGTWHRRIGGSSLQLMQTAVIPWGDADAFQEPATFLMFKQLQIMWKLARQLIAVSTREQVSRPTWRSKHNWREIKHVTVFTLRRAQTPRYRGEAGKANYTHRFPVRTHWRNQWYPSIKAHRQKLIFAYVKGDPELPFLAKKSAVEFIR